MILIRNLRMETEEKTEDLRRKTAKKLRVRETDILELHPVKRSLDARKKNDIHYTCSVAVQLRTSEEKILDRGDKDLLPYTPPVYDIPLTDSEERPVVTGFGPAGMFAALVLARAGARPIVVERGQEALKRKEAVENFRRNGCLNTESNVQFGEGGAGTFSDGKLNTGTHDRRMFWVLKEFAGHGAPESIQFDAKPHIGTDILIEVVQNIRREIVALGGEVRFETRLDGLEIRDGRLCGIRITRDGKTEAMPCRHMILAIGHSARDSFTWLYGMGMPMERKPFSMGVRIEHRQTQIDQAQYGRERRELPPADYSLHVRFPDGSSAYTFCMCPGGQVFASASEAETIVTNGMSYSRRDGENANAALLVTLGTEDFPGDGVLAGMEWQRQIERDAFAYTGSYRAPAQLVGDFLAGKPSKGPGSVIPSYTPGVFWGDMRKVLPEKITDVLSRAIPALGRKLKNFDDPEAVLTGPETRSSSPVRIMRDDSLQSSFRGIYPCGEGAGYAGGITSAAVDGMRCAEAILRDLSADKKTESYE